MTSEKSQSDQSFVPSYLLYLLAKVSDRASAEFHAHARAEGLRVPEWRVLASLTDEDGAMTTRLAWLSMMEQSRLTRIIDQMVERGLVIRRSDPQDGRRVRVFLTLEGRALALRLREDAQAHEARILARLDPEDAARLKPLLATMLEQLEAPEGDQSMSRHSGTGVSGAPSVK
ncbi:MarR family winged helix-turn-helix transcriptional regulator [Pseudodonghicola flavimaris]|uniref:MarR family transcriptional regulator n=1 Tax=Pseudodonghicola flavimaris TaxID=3050036 RepID=A0ABT7F7T3_9RHOB|nr:MarR family transcriptional regulator [Pseudodonghicola flavimaris]MDK3020677.1 MarR family transcriptional regulator [Pseudodonghicola flavimaris]